MKTYTEQVTCQVGHLVTVRRRALPGRLVRTWCAECGEYFYSRVGPNPNGAPAPVPAKPLRESQIEQRLKERALALGGEVRKVRWIGRRGAPDRLVMLPALTGSLMAPGDCHSPALTIWVELKAPGRGPTAAQLREHERMRKMGQRVEVVDSYERVEEVLR